MKKRKMYNEVIEEYRKKIKINTFFNENGLDIRTIMKDIILSNCDPVQRKKLEL